MSPQSSIGHYRITAKLGEGGMGVVYRATDTKLNREVAVKVLPSAFAQDPDRMARFEREAQVLASLNHPGIAAIYGIEERALVMELVEGGTLAERIAQGPLSLDEALAIASQIAEALECAHEKNVIHRDLKPANVKVTPEGRVKVLDFGLAAVMHASGASAAAGLTDSPTLTISPTRAGMILGTAAYMSPEQARGSPADKRADIWAFGAVLYEMLVGQPAFPGESVAETLAGVLKLDPDWDLLPGSTPEPIRRLVRRCLTKDRQQRLQAIGEARITIDEVLSGEGLEDTRSTPRPQLGRAWMVMGAFAAAAIVAFWAPWRPPPTEAPLFTFNIDPPEGEVFFGGLSISPDGRQIAAPVQDSSGQRYIRVFRLDSRASRRLPDTEGALTASWSPNSRYLVFKTGSKLNRIDVNGGPPQYLCDIPSNVPPFTAWSSEGVILFSRQDGLWRVSAAGNTPTQVTVVDASRQELHFSPQFVRDGRHFLYWISNRDSARSALFSGSLDGSPVKGGNPVFEGINQSPIYSPGLSNGDYLLFERRGALMAQSFNSSKLRLTGEAFLVVPQVGTVGGGAAAASVSNNGVLAYSSVGSRRLTQFAWFDRSGKRLSDVGPPGLYAEFSLSPNEKSIAVFRLDGGIWTLDMARNGLAQRFIFDSSRRPIWSPDGSRIIFAKSGSSSLYEKAVRGNGVEQPLLGSVGVPTGWSRDGRYLLSTNNGDLWILANGKSDPFQRTESTESEGQLSPDGKWIAYTSDESKQPEVYVQTFPTPGGKQLISTAGGSQPRWRSDGKELFYVAADGKMMAVSIRGGPSFQYDTPAALFQAPIQDFPNAFGYAVASEGQRFLIRAGSKDAKSFPITVMTNWLAVVKK